MIKIILDRFYLLCFFFENRVYIAFLVIPFEIQ